MKKTAIVVLLISVLLVGCDASAYTPPAPHAPDLQGTRQAVDLALRRTADAQEQIQASATMAAASTDQASRVELERLAVEITATAVARDYAAQDATATQLAGMIAAAEAESARLTATADAESAALTATAWPATATRQSFEATSQAVALQIEIDRLDDIAAKKRLQNWIADYGYIPAGIIIGACGAGLLIALFVFLIDVLMPTYWNQHNTIQRKDGGLTVLQRVIQPPPPGAGFWQRFVGRSTTIVANPDRHAGSALAIGPSGVESTGYSPDQTLHLLWMQQQAMIEALRAMAMSGGVQDFRKPAIKVLDPMIEQAQAPQLPGGQLPPVAPWSIVENWRGPGFSIGVDELSQPVIVDPETTPHLLVAGTSGTGKTRGILLPVVVQALNSGWNVVLVNDRAADFATVRSHPALVNPSKDDESKVATIEQVAAEVRRRDRVLRDARVTTWSRLPSPPPPLMLVVDEMVSFAWTLRSTTPDLAKRLWSAIITITSEGRKMAIMFVGATTDPTYRTLGREGLTVRENCGRVAMKMKNAAQSRAILDEPDAESLDRFEFVAALGFGDQVRGRAFSPDDHQLLHAISRPVIEVLPPLELPEPKVQVDAYDPRIDRVQKMAEEGYSMRFVENKIFGYAGGAAHEFVSKNWPDSATTTTDAGDTDQ